MEIKNIAIIAHQDHLPIVIKTAKKLGFIVKEHEIENIPYDKMSIQFRTRTRMRFLIHETISKIAYLITGKI